MDVADFAKGPIHPSIASPQVIYGGVDGTKISKEERPVKMTANEFLEKMGMPVAGQIVTDGSKSTQSRKSHGMEGPLAKARSGKGKDPQEQVQKPGKARLAPLASRGGPKTPDDDKPCKPGHTPMDNSKSAALRFFASVLQKLGFVTYPDQAPAQVPPPAPNPLNPANAGAQPQVSQIPPPMKTSSWVLQQLKQAAGEAGLNYGSTDTNTQGIVVKPPEPAAKPKGTTMPGLGGA